MIIHCHYTKHLCDMEVGKLYCSPSVLPFYFYLYAVDAAGTTCACFFDIVLFFSTVFHPSPIIQGSFTEISSLFLQGHPDHTHTLLCAPSKVLVRLASCAESRKETGFNFCLYRSLFFYSSRTYFSHSVTTCKLMPDVTVE